MHVTPLGRERRGVVVAHENITERKRMETALARRAQEFTALYETSIEINSQLDLQTLLRAIVQRATDLIGVRSGGLYLMQPDEQSLRVVVSYNLTSDYAGTILRLGEGLSGRVAQMGQPMTVDDYNQWEGRAAVYTNAAFRRVLGVPLKIGDRVIGVIDITDDQQSGPFSEDDIRLVSLFADQAAIAVENARLYERAQREIDQRVQLAEALQQRNLDLSLLNRVNQAIASSLDLDEVLTTVLEEVCQLFVACSIWLIDSGTNEVVCRQATGPKNEAVRGWRLPIGQGLVGWVALSGQSLIVPDAHADERYFPGVEQQTGLALRSILSVPLRVKQKVIGVIQVMDEAVDRFDATDLSLIEPLAAAAAIAIENARLHQAALQASESRAILYHASLEIGASLDPEQVYTATHRAAGRLMPAEAFAITLVDDARGEIEPVYLIDRGGRTSAPRIRIDQGLSGRVISTGEALRLDDVEQGNAASFVHFGHPEQIRSVLAVPMRHGDKVLGVLSAQSYRSHAYSLDDQQILSTLANHAATAIENARLFEAAQRELVERNRAEQALRASETRYRAIVEDQTELICRFLMPGGELTFVNDAYCRYFGQPRESLIGRSFMSIVYDADQDRVSRLIEGLNNVEPVTMIEHRAQMPNGEMRWLEWTNRALFRENGWIEEYQATARDVTGRKQAEEQLRESLREKEVLLKEVHHRVKNNLQIISSLLDLQSDYIQDPMARAMFDDSQRRIRIMALIHEQLYRSKDLARINFQEYIRNLADELLHSYAANPHAIALRLDIADVSMSVDMAIPCSLIINELVSNSLKYAFPGERQGEIQITLQSGPEHYLILRVSDDGVGLPEGLDFRNTSSLGLQLVYMLSHQIRGVLSREPGQGTTFTIIFPRSLPAGSSG
jgi:PAS domain S-box-containing protein